jgi:hypothetical protein
MRILLCCIFALGSGFSRSAGAQVLATEGQGRSAVTASGPEVATQEARVGATRDCVLRAAVQVMGGEAAIPAGGPEATALDDKAMELVQDMRVLEASDEGVNRTLRILCKIRRDRLEAVLEDLRVGNRRERMPRMLLVLDDAPGMANVPLPVDPSVARGAFTDRMEKRGFSFLEEVRLALQKGPGPEPSLRDLGRLAGAEIVVKGNVQVERVGTMVVDGKDWHSTRASISARAIRVDTDALVAVASAASIGMDFDEATSARKALQSAGQQLADEVAAKVAKTWGVETSAAREVEVRVTGAEDHAVMAELKARLLGVKGVKDVQQRSMEDGRAGLSVRTHENSESLATKLATYKGGGLKVRVTQVTPGVVSVKVSPAPVGWIGAVPGTKDDGEVGAPAGTGAHGCGQDTDCKSGFSCRNSKCVPRPECERNDDCGAGKGCDAGRCVGTQATAAPSAGAPVVVERFPTIEAPESVTRGRPFVVQVLLAESELPAQTRVTGGRKTAAGGIEMTFPPLDPDRESSWKLDVVLSFPPLGEQSCTDRTPPWRRLQPRVLRTRG